MGSRGPRPKDPAKRQRRRSGESARVDLAILPGGLRIPPVPAEWDEYPADVAKQAEIDWDNLFRSDVGRAIGPVDLPSVRRLFAYRMEFDRLTADTLRPGFAMYVEGSTGQPQLNPIYKRLDALEGHIRSLEDRFGLHTRERLAMSASVVDHAKNLDELNRRARAESDGAKAKGRRKTAIHLATE